jgi:hypothetical protein
MPTALSAALLGSQQLDAMPDRACAAVARHHSGHLHRSSPPLDQRD